MARAAVRKFLRSHDVRAPISASGVETVKNVAISVEEGTFLEPFTEHDLFYSRIFGIRDFRTKAS